MLPFNLNPSHPPDWDMGLGQRRVLSHPPDWDMGLGQRRVLRPRREVAMTVVRVSDTGTVCLNMKVKMVGI